MSISEQFNYIILKNPITSKEEEIIDSNSDENKSETILGSNNSIHESYIEEIFDDGMSENNYDTNYEESLSKINHGFLTHEDEVGIEEIDYEEPETHGSHSEQKRRDSRTSGSASY